MGDDTPHWEGLGRILPQGGPQADGEATSEREVWCMGLPPSGGRDGGGGIVGGGYPCLPPSEKSCTIYYDQAYYGYVSSGKDKDIVKGDQEVAGAGWIGCGGNVNSGLGGGTDVEGGGDGRDRDGDGYGLSWWEYNIVNVTLGTEPNALLAYAPGLEHHHPNMSTLGEPVR